MFKIGDRVIRTNRELAYWNQEGVIVTMRNGMCSAEVLFDSGESWICLNGTFELVNEDLENV